MESMISDKTIRGASTKKQNRCNGHEVEVALSGETNDGDREEVRVMQPSSKGVCKLGVTFHR